MNQKQKSKESKESKDRLWSILIFVVVAIVFYSLFYWLINSM
jgi:preprotein translocase subunit SecE